MIITIAWLPVLLIPLVRPVHGDVAETFAVIDYTVWALFGLEYVIKLYLAPNRSKFFRTHILDLIIVAVPFFRPARAGRLLNVARLGRVGVILAKAIQLGKQVFTHRGMHFVVLTALITVFVSAGLVTMVERTARGSNIHNFGQGLWWAVVTVTTVGYGDRNPVTGFGQGVAVFLMVFGIGLIGILTATVASYFVGQDLDEAKNERTQIREELAAARAERDHLQGRVEEMHGLLLAMADATGAKFSSQSENEDPRRPRSAGV
jgi:voltage-gated potassium channel